MGWILNTFIYAFDSDRLKVEFQVAAFLQNRRSNEYEKELRQCLVQLMSKQCLNVYYANEILTFK